MTADRDFDDICIPSTYELEEIFLQKYGAPDKVGWAPRRRYQARYYLPADIYEATVKKLVFDGCAWIDVGGGHSIFPENPLLARQLVSRCSLVVGVDPSENIDQNDFVHQRFRCLIEDFQTDKQFDLVTLRMVAEHISEPSRVVKALHRLLHPKGVVVIFTVNMWSPITIISLFAPFYTHYPVKKLFWGGESEDTFPVQYKMNTREILQNIFQENNFHEIAFSYLDDLSAFGRFSCMNHIELLTWKIMRRLGMCYPENCLLGVYRKA